MKKALPNPEQVSSDLFGLHYQAMRWELMKTALKLSLFDHLTSPADAAEISSRLQINEVNTVYFLNGLVGLGCLSKQNGRYQNTPLAETYFTTSKDTSLKQSMLFQESWIKPILNGGLMNLLKDGPASSEDPSAADVMAEDTWETGARSNLNYNRCGRAQRMASLVADLPEYPDFKRMLDMGCGPGIMGIAVVATHPTLECVLFDRPSVCKVAEEVIDEYGMGDRVTTMTGDYMEDPIGGEYDLIMANYTLNFYRDRLDEIMAKTLQALRPGGLFLVTSDGLNKDQTEPSACVLSWLPIFLQGTDLSIPAGLISSEMLKAGFQSTERRFLPHDDFDPHGAVEMTIGRKGALT